MKRRLACGLVLGILVIGGCKSKPAAKPEAGAAAPAAIPSVPAAEAKRAVIETSLGEIEVELFRDRAPKGVANFTQYAERGTYDGTIFHRVVNGVVIQGGGYDRKFAERPTQPPIPNEADRAPPNQRGTIAWARTPDPHSATTQFFINVKDNKAFNHRGKNPTGWGYAVFGRVVRGMEVVDKIGDVQIEPRGVFPSVPVDTVLIRRVRLAR